MIPVPLLTSRAASGKSQMSLGTAGLGFPALMDDAIIGASARDLLDSS
jgi:hypothetical protein